MASLPPLPPAAKLALILLVTFLAYVPAVTNDFTYDDRYVAMGHNGEHRNEMVAELQPLGEYFHSHYWRGTEDHSRLYRPVTVLSYALRHALAGDDARIAHLLNILLHVAATALVFGLLRSAGSGPTPAHLGALAFGLHAIHSEAVVAVFGRAELLAFCFGAAALLLLKRARRQPTRGRWALRGAAALLFFLAMGSKESALAWIPFAGCLLWLSDGRPQGRARALVCDLLILVAAATVVLWLRWRMLAPLPGSVTWHAAPEVNPLFDLPTGLRMAGAVTVWGFALLLTAFPWQLSAEYGAAVLPVATSWSDPAVLWSAAAAVLLLGVMASGVFCARRQPPAFLAVAAFFGFSFVISNFALPIGTILGERLYYAPSLGVAFALAWLAARPCWQGRWRTPGLLVLGVWLGASTLVLVQRTADWRDDETLIQAELREQPSAARIQLFAGQLRARAGSASAAIAHLERAVALAPDYREAWRQLADLYGAVGDVSRERYARSQATCKTP